MIKRGLSLVLLAGLLFPTISFAQENDCPEPDKKARKTYEEALANLGKKNPELAYKLLIEATRLDPEYAEPFLRLAKINQQKSETSSNPSVIMDASQRALKYYGEVARICPNLENGYAMFMLASMSFSKEKYADAKVWGEKFLAGKFTSEFNEEAKLIVKSATKYLELTGNPVPFNPVKVAGLNTREDEFLPLITPDGELMFFTHRYSKVMDMGTTLMVDEFSVADKTSTASAGVESFGSIRPMKSPFNVNKKLNQGAVSITIDNNHLYMTICGEDKNCDIWVSDFVDGEWTPLRNLGASVNGIRSWESQPSISSDGKILYFSSIRPGNIGFDLEDPSTQTSDIWVSEMDAQGNWKPAKNLGTIINTTGNEKSPFIHSDSQTLYFASDGREGVGGYDIYFTKKKADGTWSVPKNIGFPINSEGNDIGFMVSTDGKRAYFASNEREDAEGWDVYSFELYPEARPVEVMLAKGDIKDTEGNAVEDVKVEVENVTTNRVYEGMVDKMTGKYAIAIPVETPESEFIMTVKKEDYAFTSEYIKPKEVVIEVPVKVDFEMKPVEVGTKVKINNIYFATSSAVFEKESMIVLDHFLVYLEENPGIKIEIHGHTDNVGDDASNMKLSEDRAKAVRDYLILMGLDQSRISNCKGFGETLPVSTNDTEAGRSLNRRTEFVIVEK